MTEQATDAPAGADFSPVNVVVLKAGRIRYTGAAGDRLRQRLAVGRVIQLPRYLATKMFLEPGPKVRPAQPEEVVQAPQFDLGQYPNAPGFQPTDTSKEAAEAVSATAGQVRKLVLEAVTRQGDFGATAEELAAMLRRPRGTVQPRTTELQAQGKLKDSGKRRQNLSSGRKAIVWIAADGDRPRKATRGEIVKSLKSLVAAFYAGATDAGDIATAESILEREGQ